MTRRMSFTCAVLGVGLAAGVLPAYGQGVPATAPGAAADQAGLLSLIPGQAILFIERRGHDAVHEAFSASNLGQMWKDEVIQQFVIDSGARIEQMIVKSMFDTSDQEEIEQYQQTLNAVLKPLWYRPAAMFLLYDPAEKDSGSGAPGLGFLCLTGDYMKNAKDALDALMKRPLKAEGSQWQAFTYKSGAITWQGIAKPSEEGKLPEDPKALAERLKKSDLIMVTWHDNLLCAALGLKAADAISQMLAGTGKPIAQSASFQAIQARTALKDWAFRWYVNIQNPLKEGIELAPPQEKGIIRAFGVDKFRGIGGTEGYADNVYASLTYLDAPGAGVLKLFGGRGSYKPAMAMIPNKAFLRGGGNVDVAAIVQLCRTTSLSQAEAARTDGAASQPASAPGAPADPRQAEVLRLAELLAAASDGNACQYLMDLQSMVMGGMMGGNTPTLPIGYVLGIKDAAKANQAVDALVKLAAEEQAADDPGAGRPKEYRKVPIRYAGSMARVAVLKDRLVIGLSDEAMKAGVDAALDNSGGFAPDSQGAKLLALAGEGSFAVTVDMPAIVQVFWPLLNLALAGGQGDFPLASLPPVDKMTSLLGPEVMVLQPDAGGLLMRSRGTIPFMSKAMPSLGSFGLAAAMVPGAVAPAPAPAPALPPPGANGGATSRPNDEGF